MTPGEKKGRCEVSGSANINTSTKDKGTIGHIAREILRYELIEKQTNNACEILHAALGDHGPDDDDAGCGCRMLTIELLASRAAVLIQDLRAMNQEGYKKHDQR